MTPEQIAGVLKCTKEKISRIESGNVGIRRLDLGIALDHYGVSDTAYRERLEELARTAKNRGLVQSYGDGIPSAYVDFIDLESDSRYIRTWQPMLIPGLLQTEAYTRAVLDANPASIRLGDIEQFVKIRADRKQVLTGDQPVRFSAIVWEPVLHCAFGGPEQHREQLRHLVEMGQLPNVTIQVVPLSAGATAGSSGAFVLFSFEDSPTPGAVFLESLTSSHYLEDPSGLDDYVMVYDSLRSSALNPDRSLTTIAEIAAM